VAERALRIGRSGHKDSFEGAGPERLTVSAVPEGDCMVPLPWLGVRFGLSSADCVRWFGGGSGDAYPDTRTVSAVGR
jgi:hypothetical protein